MTNWATQQRRTADEKRRIQGASIFFDFGKLADAFIRQLFFVG